MYAVFDLETTGLRNADRVIEIAIVHVDHCGQITSTWHTLVNPKRDLGPTHIHKIRAADVRGAPAFSTVAGDIASRLVGRIPVAHNMSFDSRLIEHEYRRMDVDFPNLKEFGLCTMTLAPTYFANGARSLTDCCTAAGITIERPHEALADALVTAELLSYYLKQTNQEPPWSKLQHCAQRADWPTLPTGLASTSHRGSKQRNTHSLLDHFPKNPTIQPTSEQIQKYLQLLDHALLDRHISTTEADTLIKAAHIAGISSTCALYYHEQYFHAHPVTTVAENRPQQYAELAQLASLLELPDSCIDRALVKRGTARRPHPVPRFVLRAGDTVVLTGSFLHTKKHWAQRFREVGLHVADYVTRQTALVVAADPDSLSGKAEKARHYKIPIVMPQAITRLLSEAQHA